MNILTEFKKIFSQFGLEYFNRYYSIYRGVVSENKDPEFRGRLKIQCPAAYQSTHYEYWALPSGLPSGETTLWQIPSVGDVVWVQFEGGDVSKPVWSWGAFAGNKAPKAAKVDGVNIKATVWQSASGHRLILDDKNGVVTIETARGGKVVIDKDSTIILDAPNVVLSQAAQAAVRGDDLKRLLTQVLTALETARTVDQKPLSPDTIAQLTAQKLLLPTILSKSVKLK